MSGDEGADLKLRRTRSSTFSPVWNYFTKGNKNGQFYEATCNFCSHKFTWGKAGEMISHLKHKCPLAPLEVKTDPTLISSPPKPRKGNGGGRTVARRVVAPPTFTGDEEGEGEGEGGEVTPMSAGPSTSRRARPRKPVWDFFHMGKAYHNSHAAKCRYCGKEYAAGIPEQMTGHLVKSCPLAPVEIKEALASDPTGQSARELATDFVLSNEVDWEWNGGVGGHGGVGGVGGNGDAVSKLLEVDDEGTVAEQTAKRTQKTLAEGRKPGTGQAGMGRSRNTVWEHFRRGVKRGYFYEIFCKYCNYSTQTGVPVKMIEHLKIKCPLAPDSVKNEEFYRPDRHSAVQTNGHGSQARRDTMVGQNGSQHHSLRSNDRIQRRISPTDSPDSDEGEGEGEGSALTRAVGLTALTPYTSYNPHTLHTPHPAHTSKRVSHFDASLTSRSKRKRTIPQQISCTMRQTVQSCGSSPVDEGKFHQALSRCLTMCGMPIALLEHPAFRQLLLSVNDSVNIPSPLYFSEFITESEMFRVESKTDAFVEGAVYITVGVKVLGDVATCLLLITLVTCIDENGQKRSFVKSVDKVPEGGGESEDGSLRWITERITAQVEEIGAKKIVAVVDSHEGRMMSSTLPRHIPLFPSVLPIFEDLLSDVIKHKYTAALAESCQFVTSFLNAHMPLQEKLRAEGVEVSLKKLQVGVSSPRGMAEGMQSLLHYQEPICKVMGTLFGEGEEGDVPYAMRFVGSAEFWQQLGDVVALVEPLVAAVGMAQSETITLGDAFYFLLAYGKRLSAGGRKGTLSSIPAELNRACILHLNMEFAKLDSPTLRLSYLLHPLYRGDGLFDLLPDDVLLEAGEWSKSMARTADQTVSMIKQLRRYKAHLPPFSEPFRASDSPMSFWQRLTSSAGMELRQLAIRLLAVSPATAIAGPEWNAAVLANTLRVMSADAVGKIIQLQHFYHVNAQEEFGDVKADCGGATHLEKLAEIVRSDGEMAYSSYATNPSYVPNVPNVSVVSGKGVGVAGGMKDERLESDMSDGEVAGGTIGTMGSLGTMGTMGGASETGEDDVVSLYLETLVDFGDAIFEGMPKAWTPIKTTLKVEDGSAAVGGQNSEEYDVRQLLLGMEGE